jgi:glycosyltransferase involved in cell wall biosynthesis
VRSDTVRPSVTMSRGPRHAAWQPRAGRTDGWCSSSHRGIALVRRGLLEVRVALGQQPTSGFPPVGSWPSCAPTALHQEGVCPLYRDPDITEPATTTKPLISFYVISCDQERFVAEAVAGALAQTWTPLEVVLSDDHSQDRTFPIIQELARAYNGPHRVVLNRNDRRLGVGAHINRVIGLCSGQWIVASAGDDVSAPERTATLRNHWEADGRRAGLVCSGYVEMSEGGVDGRIQHQTGGLASRQCRYDYRTRLRGNEVGVHGATLAYPRRVFDDFGPLWEGVVFEDSVLNWRAELTGGVLVCPAVLVRHRNHPGQITNIYSRRAITDADARRRQLQWSRVVTSRQNMADAQIAMARGWLDTSVFQATEELLTRQSRIAQTDYELLFGALHRRWRLLMHGPARHGKRVSQLLFAALPRTLYMAGLRVVAWFSRSWPDRGSHGG